MDIWCKKQRDCLIAKYGNGCYSNFMEHHWRTEKILDIGQAATIAADLKAQGKKIVTVNGGFDILHAGHLDILEEARQQGDVLFVGVNSDKSIKDKKGPERPFVPQAERM